ncbi:MAG: OmpA family protein [Aquificae bacterium]|nr:OmpA family protein [Aquificota bacterium]
MNKKLLSAFLSALTISTISYSHNHEKEDVTLIIPQIGYHFFDEDRYVFDREKFTVGLSLDHIIEDGWGLGAYLGYGRTRMLRNPDYRDFFDFALYGSKYFNTDKKFLPYLSLGFGASRLGSKNLAGLYGALGALYFFKRNWAVNLSIKDFHLFKGKNDIVTTLGIGYAFGIDSSGRIADKDNDGVPDDKDNCPDTPEGVKVDSVGCPLDSDKDGVPDYKDKCPDTPVGTSVNNEGCPLDSDKDGVPDYQDRCPDTPEGVKVDRYGCPEDKDLDGIPDYKDKCPNTPTGVKVDENGCPVLVDSDKDGVPDDKDKCPNTPAGVLVNNEGCPLDSDKDGVPDGKDKCPNTPAGVVVDSVGCPLDSDKDGVPDYKDKCPNTPAGAVVDNEGCPLDSDKDGVPDYKDECPNTPEGAQVDEKGCLVQVRLEIYFDLDSAEVKPEYYSEIEKLAIYLKANPDVKIEIQGHTDSLGPAEYNLKLSQARAEAVKRILVEEFGIDPDRIIAKGYGESQPIASNETEEGRAKNRRVVVIQIK